MNVIRKRTMILIISALFIAASFSGCIDDLGTEEKTTLKIFHAGSLAVPFSKIEERFEEMHPDVEVQREPYGSAAAIRQVTEVGKVADLVASADYTLIDQMMVDSEPQWAESNVLFAKNTIVLAYTDDSIGAKEINVDNWYDLLKGDDVRYGISNGNHDPCGYRALMMLRLAEDYYEDNFIFDDLVEEYSGIYADESEGGVILNIPTEIAPGGKLLIREKETDLLHLLQTGDIDYAVEYRSIAVQHDLNFIELPDEINLGSVDFKGDYARVQVQQYGDSPGTGQLITAKPIVYGITIPLNAPHRDLAVEFIKLLTGAESQAIFDECGQPPIVPAICTGAALN